MKLLFKQRLFSWLDSYDIYDENSQIVYTIEGKLSWGHRLVIYDQYHEQIAEIKEEVLTFLPKFVLYVQDREVGKIEAEFAFFKPKFHLTCQNWRVEGDIWEWEYDVSSPNEHIMHASKEVLNWTDTYVLDIVKEENALYCLMIVLAIDAAKCSRNN